jgi:hypothetical protein
VKRGQQIIAVVFLLAFGLGMWSVRAIRRASNQKLALADALSMRVPTVPGARVLLPWQPVPEAELAHMTLCFDDSTSALALARVSAVLVGTPWRPVPATDTTSDFPAIAATDGAYRLRAGAEPGHRGDCDTNKHQVIISMEGASAVH